MSTELSKEIFVSLILTPKEGKMAELMKYVNDNIPTLEDKHPGMLSLIAFQPLDAMKLMAGVAEADALMDQVVLQERFKSLEDLMAYSMTPKAIQLREELSELIQGDLAPPMGRKFAGFLGA